jgi:hypothetical protein
MAGKWHLGHGKAANTPVGRGFESHVGCYMWDIDSYSKQMFAQPWMPAKSIDWVHDFSNGTRRFELNPEHATVLITQRAQEVVRQTAAARRAVKKSSEGGGGGGGGGGGAPAEDAENARPLFLFVAFTAAHSPLQPHPRHMPACASIAHPWRRDFCGMVVGLDEGVKNLTATLLEELGGGGGGGGGGTSGVCRCGRGSAWQPSAGNEGGGGGGSNGKGQPGGGSSGRSSNTTGGQGGGNNTRDANTRR